jgi:hypothetical protein
MSGAFYAINYRGKNNNYNWLSYHRAYVSQWDAQRDEIFTKMHHVIIEDK